MDTFAITYFVNVCVPHKFYPIDARTAFDLAIPSELT